MGDVADQCEGADFEYADTQAGDRQQRDERDEGAACHEQHRADTIKSQTEDDRRLAPPLVCQNAQEDCAYGDRGHGHVVEGGRGLHAEIELGDELRNDRAHRVRGHREHEEHQIRQALDQPEVPGFLRSVRPTHPGSPMPSARRAAPMSPEFSPSAGRRMRFSTESSGYPDSAWRALWRICASSAPSPITPPPNTMQSLERTRTMAAASCPR